MIKMQIPGILRNLWIILIVLANIGCDQAAKSIVRNEVEDNARIEVMDNFITLTKVENTGAFLSLGSEMPRAGYLITMILLPLIAIGFAVYYLLKNQNLSRETSIALALVTGGGLGNIIDRIRYGSVTDFLHFNFGVFQTGIVNLADISITTGFLIIVTKLVITRRISNGE